MRQEIKVFTGTCKVEALVHVLRRVRRSSFMFGDVIMSKQIEGDSRKDLDHQKSSVLPEKYHLQL